MCTKVENRPGQLNAKSHTEIMITYQIGVVVVWTWVLRTTFMQVIPTDFPFRWDADFLKAR